MLLIGTLIVLGVVAAIHSAVVIRVWCKCGVSNPLTVLHSVCMTIFELHQNAQKY